MCDPSATQLLGWWGGCVEWASSNSWYSPIVVLFRIRKNFPPNEQVDAVAVISVALYLCSIVWPYFHGLSHVGAWKGLQILSPTHGRFRWLEHGSAVFLPMDDIWWNTMLNNQSIYHIEAHISDKTVMNELQANAAGKRSDERRNAFRTTQATQKRRQQLALGIHRSQYEDKRQKRENKCPIFISNKPMKVECAALEQFVETLKRLGTNKCECVWIGRRVTQR